MPTGRLPLFPQMNGTACVKTAFVATIAAAAVRLDVPLQSTDGSTRVSGHSLRVAGAQGLSRMGYPLWAIQLLGRWGSEAVKGYVGDAALDIFSQSSTTNTTASDDLEAIFAAAGRVAPAARPAGRSRPILDDARIDQVVQRHVGDLRSDLEAPLRAEIAAEIRRALPRPAARAEQGTTTAPPLVQNDRTKVVHVIAVGPDDVGSSSQWVSLCTWEFGRWGGFSFVGGALAVPTCERCLSRGPK